MNSRDFKTYLDDFKYSNIFKKCKTALNRVSKICKNMTDAELLQFIEIIAMYYENDTQEPNISESPFNTISIEEAEFEEFAKMLAEQIYEQTDGSQSVLNLNNREKVVQNNQSKENEVNWIKRPILVMSIGKYDITINDSLMTYIKEISESMNPRMIMMEPINRYGDTVEDDNLPIKCVMGNINDNVALSLMSGVTNIHKFEFIETNNGGKMIPSDVRHFHAQTKNKFSGLYIFELDEKFKSLIGKKFNPIEIEL